MDSRIHICILTSAHPIDDVRVSHKFAHTFIREGFRVTWVGPDYRFSGPDGWQEDQVEYRLFPRAEGKLGRLLAWRGVHRNARPLGGVDVFYCPDPDAAAVAVRLAREKNAHVIFDVHEMYHKAMLSRWIKGPAGLVAAGIIRRHILRTCSRCDLVVGVNEAVLKPYRQACADSLILRSCAPACFAQGPAADVCNPGRSTFTIMHGKADLWRGTGTVLEALRLARERVPGLRSIMFETAYGFDSQVFRRRVAALQLEDAVDLRAAVGLHEMPAILRTCDAGLIAYARQLGADSLPNRLFEYMAAGLPIIAPQYSTQIARVLHEEQCGLTADFENPASVAAAIVELSQNPGRCRDMSKRARQAFENRHNWEAEVKPLLDRIRDWVHR